MSNSLEGLVLETYSGLDKDFIGTHFDYPALVLYI